MKAHADDFTRGGHRSIKYQIVAIWGAMKGSIKTAQDARENDPTLEYIQRPARSVNIDGSAEIAWGTFVFCAAMTTYLSPKAPGQAALSWGLLLAMVLAPWVIPRLIKELVTWPRMGYVALPTNTKQTRLGVIVALLVGGGGSTGLALLASRQLDRHGKIPPLLAIGAVVLVLLMTAGVWWLMIKKDEESSTSERGAPPASAEPKEAALAGEVSGAEYEKIHRRVTFHLWVLFLVSFAVVPVIVGGIVYGALRMSVLHGETSAQRISLIAFLGANPLLYLMANAVCLNQYRWKWLGLLIMSLGPFVLGYVFPDMWTEMVRTGIMLPKPAMLFVALVWLCSGFATLSLFCCRHPLRQTPL